MCSVCPPCCCITRACFSQCVVVHHPAGESVCTVTLGSDIRQQSFTNNMFTVIRAAYFCSQFNENNASFAHTRVANRNRHVMHITRVRNSNSKRVSLFGTHCMYAERWSDGSKATSYKTKARSELRATWSKETFKFTYRHM